MNSLLAKLNRFAPLFMALFALTVLFQILFYFKQFIDGPSILGWIRDHAFGIAWSAGALAVVLASLMILGLLHAHQKVPAVLTRWTSLMDILDRLTNRNALEKRLKSEVEAVFVDAEALSKSLEQKVVGQNSICDDVAAQIRRRLALHQREKPVGVFLFAGPPGSGKTYLAKILAGALQRKLIHLDMTQYSSAGLAATSLFGSPKGYVGSDSFGKLTGALRDTPNSLVLLDEFEKAHSSVHKNFLTAWNDGFATEASNGSPISTVGAIFVLTTNAAIDALAALSRKYANSPDDLRREADGALRAAGFAPEVLSRIDRIFVFNPLEDLDVARVAALEIETMIHGYGLSVREGGIDPEILYDLMTRQKKFGVSGSSRDLVRAIEEAIADSLIDAKQSGIQSVGLVEDRGQVRTVASE